jgi:hypothetical protein
MPHEQAELNMRLFADRVMPVLQRDRAFDLRGGPDVDPTPPDARSAPGDPGRSSTGVFAPA